MNDFNDEEMTMLVNAVARHADLFEAVVDSGQGNMEMASKLFRQAVALETKLRQELNSRSGDRPGTPRPRMSR